MHQYTMKITCLALITGAALAANPVFPDRWQAYESTTVRQAGVKSAIHGTSYWDLAANKEVFVTDRTVPSSSPWDVIITDWGAGQLGKEYHIRIYKAGPFNKTLIKHCEEWCEPSTPEACDASDSLCQPDYVKNGKFQGTTTVPGTTTPADLFTWRDGIVINSLSLYTVPSQATPLRMDRTINIMKNANVSTDFSNFSVAADPFDPALYTWDVDMMDACQASQPTDTCTQSASFRGIELAK